MNQPSSARKGGRVLLTALLALALAGIIVYAGLMGMVWWKETHVAKTDQYDAIIVLGAQVKADGSLSVQLQWRLDTAYQAWLKHPCPILTCGAQGRDEPAPEGEVMRDYLISLGVPAAQITPDCDSYNTKQNIANAAKLLDGLEKATVLIVTSDYHLPRAMAIARDAGLNATGLGSPTKPEYWLKNHAREVLAWLKYWAEKYLGL